MVPFPRIQFSFSSVRQKNLYSCDLHAYRLSKSYNLPNSIRHLCFVYNGCFVSAVNVLPSNHDFKVAC